MTRVEVFEDLERVKQILLEDGFRNTILQVIKPGQVFGLVKELNHPWEMHVRGFEDGHLEAEIEISREYLEHLDSGYKKEATMELTRILDKYGIIYTVKGDMSGVDLQLKKPNTLTPWKPIALVVTLIGVAYLLSKKET
ncbi:hypothetical protein [Thermococcus sibiricus]|uniref:Uncharacterized protein n=2 Tax=Thermococcus sibiricus TaxID=172049 RepID=C6A394_THESM|nr:hypothetical protein [Thermococcus sibiricus]ACS90089.1 hypothetical protein TSIB_1033 [Thermococcus sibiricus MM 739]KUK18644.1 MAG: Uncharacterized protein XD54_0029 [Thermococcus sibiricus]